MKRYLTLYFAYIFVFCIDYFALGMPFVTAMVAIVHFFFYARGVFTSRPSRRNHFIGMLWCVGLGALCVGLGTKSDVIAEENALIIEDALKRFHRDNHCVPRRLKDITPRYLKRLPMAGLKGGGFRYFVNTKGGAFIHWRGNFLMSAQYRLVLEGGQICYFSEIM